MKHGLIKRLGQLERAAHDAGLGMSGDRRKRLRVLAELTVKARLRARGQFSDADKVSDLSDGELLGMLGVGNFEAYGDAVRAAIKVAGRPYLEQLRRIHEQNTSQI